eukprot:scaffold363_cov255-Pinguiococcus_pyrenoidosus.AAC.18
MMRWLSLLLLAFWAPGTRGFALRRSLQPRTRHVSRVQVQMKAAGGDWRGDCPPPFYLGEERDACGVGFIAQESGDASNSILAKALEALDCMEHRGGCLADERSGDGAGVMTSVPWKLLRDYVPEEDVAHAGVGMFFLPQDQEQVGDVLVSKGNRTGKDERGKKEKALGNRAQSAIDGTACQIIITSLLDIFYKGGQDQGGRHGPVPAQPLGGAGLARRAGAARRRGPGVARQHAARGAARRQVGGDGESAGEAALSGAPPNRAGAARERPARVRDRVRLQPERPHHRVQGHAAQPVAQALL